jgi:hypothetical protein
VALIDMYINKEAKAIDSYIKGSRISGLAEIETSSEVAKKLNDIKSSIAKNPSATYLVVVYNIK